MTLRWMTAVVLLGAYACTADGDTSAAPIKVREPELLQTGQAQLDRLCGRGRSDVVLDVFCSGGDPDIRSFLDLKRAFGFGGRAADLEGFALTSHSSSLVARSVSAINPRAIFIRPRSDRSELALLAFTRGDQFSESIVRDRRTGELRFYVVTFEQDCNDEPEGCSPGDLLTPAVEAGWKNLNVYAEDDLANTPLDCLVCHEPDGPGTGRILRMQELNPPWVHWFYGLVPTGIAVIDDYLAAKGDEPFVGIGPDAINHSSPGLLSSTLFFEDSSSSAT